MIAKPIPFALSRVKIQLKKANDTNTIEIKHPDKSIINPAASGALIKRGIPAPNKKANTIAIESPANKLIHIFFRLKGWLSKSSINSELL